MDILFKYRRNRCIFYKILKKQYKSYTLSSAKAPRGFKVLFSSIITHQCVIQYSLLPHENKEVCVSETHSVSPTLCPTTHPT